MILASSVKFHSCSVTPAISCSGIGSENPFPFLQQSGPVLVPLQDVQNFPSSYGSESSAMQLLPEHFWQVGQVPALPVVLGSPPQCQPALSTPTPGSDLMTDPSSLTVAVPIATNDARSWS